MIYEAGAVPVGGTKAPIKEAADVVENKTFHPYGQWKTVKKKLTVEQKEVGFAVVASASDGP